MNQDKLEAAKPEFVCMRVSNNEVVDTFDTVEKALALVMKHARHKKANLYVLDTSTNKQVVFFCRKDGGAYVAYAPGQIKFHSLWA